MSLMSAHIGGDLSANAASAVPAAGADFTSRSFGLAMRFAVTFVSGDGSGVTKLGEWSSCKGLKVEFKTEPVKLGGMYDHELKLPTQVAYGPVVLERAMEQKSSRDLQVWLGSLVTSWMRYGESKEFQDPAGQVTIDLFDAHQKVVASWTLLHAYPVSWSGPTLDAKGNTVAIETLTLEHQGFLPPQPALNV